MPEDRHTDIHTRSSHNYNTLHPYSGEAMKMTAKNCGYDMQLSFVKIIGNIR